MKTTEGETVAQNRGDGTYLDRITNQYLIDMIENYKEFEKKIKGDDKDDKDDRESM